MGYPTSANIGTEYVGVQGFTKINDHFADASQHERPVLNGKDFGMVGNNTGDNTTAFNAAQVAAEAISAKLFIPKGTYRFTTSITPRSHITVEGEGEGTVFSYTGAGTWCFMNNLNGVTWRDLMILGSAS